MERNLGNCSTANRSYKECCRPNNKIEIVYGSLIVSKLHFGSFYQCKEDLLVITYNNLVMNLSQLSKHCLSIVCLNVVDLKQGMLSVDPISQREEVVARSVQKNLFLDKGNIDSNRSILILSILLYSFLRFSNTALIL